MNSLFRRTISFLMALVMCISMVPVSALAAEDVVIEQPVATEGVSGEEESSAPAEETEESQETTAPETTAGSTEPEGTESVPESEGTTAPEETEVVTEPVVTWNLCVLTLPDKIKYQVGDEIDLTGLELYLESSDGESQVITADDGITIVEGNTEAAGRIDVTVQYNGLMTSFEIQVHSVYMVGDILQDSAGYPESAHSYSNSMDKTWTYSCAGALYLKLTFSSSTLTESGYDTIYIYDGAGTQLGTYSGSSLANKTITVTGDTAKIRLKTDGSVVKYGFSLTSIYAGMHIVEHEPTDEGFYTEPLCYVDGYTEHTCWICGDWYVEPDEGSAGHVYEGGFCTGCGIPENSLSSGQLTDTISWAITEDYTLYVCGTGDMPDYPAWDVSEAVSVIIGEGVTRVGRESFYNCSNMTEVSLPNGLTSIATNSFYGCSGLTEILLPESLTSIGVEAFSYCTGLTEVEIPDGVSAMYERAFSNCTGLTSVKLPAGLAGLSTETFLGCTALTEVLIPEGLTTIGSYAFRSCTSLTEITLPGTLTEIANYAFYGCTSLADVSLNEGLTSLQYGAFYGCSALTELRLPSTLASVGRSGNNGPFYGSSVESVTLADGTAAIPTYLFAGASALKEVSVEDPADMTTIGSYAFYNSSALTGFAVPDGVTTIPEYCFYNCSTLADVTVPAGLKSIGNYAFHSCTALSELVLPEGLTSLGYSVFYGCNALTELQLPSTITSAGYSGSNGPLYGSSVASVTLADGITAIPAYLFGGASALTEVIFENASAITSIGSYAFYNCTSLTGITIPEGVTSIPGYCFQNCTALAQVTLPAGLTSISNYAFQNCTALTAVTLPEGITSLGCSVFYGCSALTELRLPATLTSFGRSGARGPLDGSGVTKVIFGDGFTSVPAYALSNYTTSGSYASKIKEVVFEDASKITSLGAYAFQNCVALTTITIPEAVTSIPNYAFYYCRALENLTLPETVTSIGSYAFYYCSSLKENPVSDTVTSVGNNAFYYCSGLSEVSIPAGQSVGAYAYSNCTGLRTLTIGDGANIGSYAFQSCTGLNSIVIGENVTLGSNAFSGVVLSGSCGEGVTYSLSVNSGILTISGTGAIEDYSPENPAPWHSLAAMITELSFGTEITGIGDYAFADCVRLETMYLPETIQTVGANSFSGCDQLTYVEIPDGVGFIGEGAFGDCDNLSQAVFLGDAPVLQDNIFGETEVEVCYPETAAQSFVRAWDKFIQYVWTKWDDTVPSKDVVILLDVSGSMGGKTGTLSTASSQLIKSIGGMMKKTRISIVTYESSAYTKANFSTNTHVLAKKVSSLSASGGTNYSNALNRAKSLLSSSDADIKFVIMFSDGQPGDSTSTINSIASGMRESGIVIYSVGLGTNSTQRQVLINVAGSASRYFEASNIAGLIAAFEELSRNFGKSEYSTVEMKINDKRVDLFKESYTLCLAADDTISFYVTLGTNEMYENVATYALEQNGQYVVQNTTGDFTNLSAARYFTEGSPVYLVLLDASGNVIERKELMLSFVSSFTVRYVLGPDMDNKLYREEVFIPANDLTKPANPSRVGFSFEGWYASENCEGIEFFDPMNYYNRTTLEKDITLYAKWEYEKSELILGRDNWGRFTNSANFFDGNYTYPGPITAKYEMTTGDYKELKSGLNFVECISLAILKNETWGGSCFGMSATTVLSDAGDLNIRNFPGKQGEIYSRLGSAEIHENTDKDDVGNIESLINYYQLRQSFDHVEDVWSDYDKANKSSDSENLRRIINKMKSANEPVIITITLMGSSSGKGYHAVVAYDLEEYADMYTFNVYDCSISGHYYYCVDVTVDDGTYSATCASWEGAWASSGYTSIFFNACVTSDDLRKDAMLTAPASATGKRTSNTASQNKYILITNYGDFDISNGSQTAKVQNGEVISGDMEITCNGLINNAGFEEKYQFILPVLNNGSYTITQSASGGLKTELIYTHATDGFYAHHTADMAGTVTVNAAGEIATAYPNDTEQTIVSTLNSMTTPWYAVEINGIGGEFNVKPQPDAVIVTSAEETNVDIKAISDFNHMTLNDVPVSSEESRVQESEDSCVVVRDNQIIAGDVYGYSVAFNSQMGTNVPTMTNVPYGSLIEEPTDPTKTGCIFEGWFVDEEYSRLWDFDTDVVTEDVILYAGWSVNPNYLKTVTFRVPGQEDQIVYIPKGDLIPAEYAPVDENGASLLWYTRADFSNDPWDFENDGITTDLTLYGKTAQCTVSYELNNGDYLADTKVYSGNLLTAPDVTMDGWTLCGWYTDAEFSRQWNFETDRIVEDVTLYAKWVENIIDKDGYDTGISIEIVNEAAVVYTGKAVVPTVIVRDDGKILQVKTDYTISFKNNTAACDKDDPDVKANKLPQIIVQGKGNYKSSGKITTYFTIHQADMADLQITVPAVVTVKPGNKVQTLKPVVSTALTKVNAKEYTALYYTDEALTQNVDGITEPGTYYVVLEGNGINLTGVSDAIRVTAATADKLLSKAKVTPPKTIFSTGDAVDEDAAIRALIEKVVLNKVTWLTSEENLAQFKELFDVTAIDTDGSVVSQEKLGVILNTVGKKVVTVTAREGNAEGLVGSATAKITVKGAPLNKKAFVVTFGENTPKPVLKTDYSGVMQVPNVYTDLVEGEDYTVTYLSGKTAVPAYQIRNAGSYSLVLTGIGNYSGSLTYKFTINPMNLVNAYRDGMITITSPGKAVYSASGAVLRPTISFRGSRQLTEGVDYVLKWSGNTKVTDKAAITVSGKGNFKGNLSKLPELTYAVEAKSLSASDITVTVSGITFKKDVVTKVSFTVADGGKKIPAAQYTSSFTDDGENVTLVIVGAEKNYTGGCTVTLSKDLIKASDKKNVIPTLPEGSKYYYTGESITPELQITDAEGNDISRCFTVTYGTNTFVGSGTITITGRPDMGYYGTVTVKFTILPKWMKWLFG